MFAYLHRISQPLVGIISNLNFINDLHTHKLMVWASDHFPALTSESKYLWHRIPKTSAPFYFCLWFNLWFFNIPNNMYHQPMQFHHIFMFDLNFSRNRIFWSFFDSLWPHRSFWENERTEVQFLKLSQTMYELDCVQVWNERVQLVATSSSMRSMSSSFSTFSTRVFQL
jgi:hypothetical protein